MELINDRKVNQYAISNHDKRAIRRTAQRTFQRGPTDGPMLQVNPFVEMFQSTFKCDNSINCTNTKWQRQENIDQKQTNKKKRTFARQTTLWETCEKGVLKGDNVGFLPPKPWLHCVLLFAENWRKRFSTQVIFFSSRLRQKWLEAFGLYSYVCSKKLCLQRKNAILELGRTWKEH